MSCAKLQTAELLISLINVMISSHPKLQAYVKARPFEGTAVSHTNDNIRAYELVEGGMKRIVLPEVGGLALRC